MSSVEKFENLFAGCTSLYLAWYPNPVKSKGFEYVQIKSYPTTHVLERHLEGGRGVSCYPVRDGKAKWAAYDIDAKDFDGDVDEAYACAVDQKNVLQDQGFHAYIERSKSGRGFHVWVFFSEWVDAEKLVDVFGGLKLPDVETWYPKQANPVAGGSALALPYYNHKDTLAASRILDSTGTAITLEEFLNTVRLNSPAILEQIVLPKRKKLVDLVRSGEKVEQISGALKVISPYGCHFMRNAWLNRETLKEDVWYTAIGQATQFKNGRDFAHLISRDYPGYSEKEVDAKYNHALNNAPRSCAYIRENFPELACKNCTVSHPYKIANKTISELAYSSTELLDRIGTFEQDIAHIKALNEGTEVSGTTFGIEGVDTIMRLRKNELIVVGGLPSIGKTWLMVESMVNQAVAGTNVFAFSAETSATPLRLRLLSHCSEIALTKLRGEDYEKMTKADYTKLAKVNEKLSKLPLYVDYTTLSADSMMSQIESAILRDRIPLNSHFSVVFDYLQFGLKQDKAESDRERFGRLVGELKMMAKILEIPVTAYSQLTRQSEAQEKPTLGWFAETSQIERNMDIGIIITGSRMAGTISPRQLWWVKQREGRSNEVLDYLLNHAHGHWQYIDPEASSTTGSLLADFGEI